MSNTETKEVSTRLTFGRHKLRLPLEKNELTQENIELYLPDILALHLENCSEMAFLYDVYKGKQNILHKKKYVRDEINKMVVENHAYEIVEFKKGFQFGNPIKYAQGEAEDTDDIGILNNYMVDQKKSKLDMAIGEDDYIVGTAYRWVLPRKVKDIKKEAPFKLITSKPLETFVVYSTNLEEDKLMGGSIVAVKNKDSFTGIDYYMTIYTDDMVYKYRKNDGDTGFEFIAKTPNGIGMIPVVEYPLNDKRLSPIEVVMSMLDALNEITSNELDDLVQFVNSLMVFYNVDVTKETLQELLDIGAVKINTTDPSKPAKLELLQGSLSHNDIDILYERLYNKALGIVGVPKQSDSPRSSGDTGQARLLGEGWTLAEKRAKADEAYFQASETEMLDIVLKICKETRGCELNELSASDIQIKFNRDKSDNMQVKSQSLNNLISAGVEFETALSTVELFSDPHSVAVKSKAEKQEQIEVNEEAQQAEQAVIVEE